MDTLGQLFLLFVLTCHFVIISSTLEKCKCGISADDELFSWIVVIETDNRPACSGSIINETTVLTMADCVYFMDSSKSVTKIQVLVKRKEGDKEVFDKFDVSHISIPKLLTDSPVRLERNIALLTVTEKFNFSDTLQPVCLSDLNFSSQISTLVASGYNLQTSEGTPALVSSSIEYFSDCKCRKKFAEYQFASGTNKYFICGRETISNATNCFRSHGGALMHRNKHNQYVQIGIYSSNFIQNGCNPKDNIGPYLKLYTFKLFLYSKLKNCFSPI